MMEIEKKLTMQVDKDHETAMEYAHIARLAYEALSEIEDALLRIKKLRDLD